MEILLQDDAKQTLTFNQRNCVLFRSGEKEILHFYIEICDYTLQLLKMSLKDAKREILNLPNYFLSAQSYFTMLILPLMQ